MKTFVSTMPPRIKFPHGLKKSPTEMSSGEKAVFGALLGSVGIGIFQLVTGPWGEEGRRDDDNAESKKQQQGFGNKTDALKPRFESDGTQVQFGSAPKTN